MLKAYMCRRDNQDMLTPDSFYVNLQGLEQWAKLEQNAVSRAVLNSLVANIYEKDSKNLWLNTAGCILGLYAHVACAVV